MTSLPQARVLESRLAIRAGIAGGGVLKFGVYFQNSFLGSKISSNGLDLGYFQAVKNKMVGIAKKTHELCFFFQ